MSRDDKRSPCPYPPKTCPYCGAEFHPREISSGRERWLRPDEYHYRRRKYCSRACADAASRGGRKWGRVIDNEWVPTLEDIERAKEEVKRQHFRDMRGG
jgi:hypothetical protein